MITLSYYYATWNSQCKNMTPILNDLQEDFPNITFVKVNNDLLEKKYTTAVPYIEIELDGKIVENLLGFKTKNALTKIIQKYE